MLFAVLLAFGCAHPRLPLGPDMALTGVDTTPLKDRLIVIDPGHGGPERGAIGVRGITEAEVNLAVGLHLWGLLKQAGARPVLTRSADQALSAGPEFDLPADLALRTQVATDAGADLFVSIHHNAALKRSVNTLIIFYAMADPYQSRDAARAIGTALQSRLDRDSHSVQPGNYTVLRSIRAPAILGEASFISNKKNELDLAYTRTLATEARGYFDGILTYFSRGVPLVRDLSLTDSSTASAGSLINACLDPGHEHARVESGSVITTVNAKPVQHRETQQGCIELVSPQLANGRHRACVAFRNTLGNSTQHCADITVALPPHSIEITSRFSVIPPEPHAASAVEMCVRDRLGRLVIDGTPVAITTSAGTLLQAETFTTNGCARAMLAAGEHAGTAQLRATSGNVRTEAHVTFAVPNRALLTLWVRDTAGRPVSGAALMYGSLTLARSDRYGCLQSETDAGLRQFQLVRQGYEPSVFTLNPAVGTMTVTNAVLQPIDTGVFLNRTIMLDPEGSSLAALPILEVLKNKIEHAGGRAVFTWQDSPAPSYQARVMQAAREGADVFLCVSAEGPSCSAGHYHRSAAGLALAQQMQQAFAAQEQPELKKCAIRQSTHDAVLHTAMPALELFLPLKSLQNNPEAVAQAMYAALREWLRQR
jgi:N-acetylmuramoyl-L-alanine amidase